MLEVIKAMLKAMDSDFTVSETPTYSFAIVLVSDTEIHGFMTLEQCYRTVREQFDKHFKTVI